MVYFIRQNICSHMDVELNSIAISLKAICLKSRKSSFKNLESNSVKIFFLFLEVNDSKINLFSTQTIQLEKKFSHHFYQY